MEQDEDAMLQAAIAESIKGSGQQQQVQGLEEEDVEL